MLVAGWDTPLTLTKHEVAQRAFEGCDVPSQLVDALNALDPRSNSDEEKLSVIQGKLAELKPRDDFPFVQPNDLDAIRAERPDGPRQLDLNLSDEQLLDRLHGAWTGRSAGCALGKPVEILGMMGHGGLNGRGAIKKYLKARNDWPLTDYVSGKPADDGGIPVGCPASLRENICYMEPDDDIHYSLIGLKVLEEKGIHFSWSDVADAWNASLPYVAICTAETQAILNYNLKTPSPHMRRQKTYTTPEFTRRHNNPYREYIGAQIRADGWAYCCAGNPELAAELAWRDAHWTHTANGIYGEMMMAAMIAAAFAESDPRRLVEIGLSEIPKNCILAECVRQALTWVDEYADFERFMERLESEFPTMSPVHTVNNALIVVMSLFYGEMDPDRSIGISVMAGLDTDCNGATVGSITGAARGKENFGGVLQAPLNDTIKPLVFGFQEITMAELAERCLAVRKTILAAR